jgi:hypothetical protein
VISLYQAAIPPCQHALASLSAVLAKGAAHAAAENTAPETLLQARLAPDMFPLTRQIQTAADFGRTIGSRLAGLPYVRVEDVETSFAELQTRLATTLEFLVSLTPDQFADAATREIVLKFPSGELRFTGLNYLQQFALPNLYFHTSMAYAILRHNGVKLGKRDFIGALTLIGP